MSQRPSVFWFRRDLRLHDNPALLTALEHSPVVPLVVLDPDLLQTPTARSEKFLESLHSLNAALEGTLVVRVGEPNILVPQVVHETRAAAVHVARATTPAGRQRDAAVRAVLPEADVDWVETGTPYAVSPGRVLTGGGTPYQVFGAFSRAWLAHGWPAPAPLPAKPNWLRGVESEEIPKSSTTQPDPCGEPGEAPALQRWADFIDEDLARYSEERDRPDLNTTSKLSPALARGEVHPRTLLAAISTRYKAEPAAVEKFRTELCWREFYADVLWHVPSSEHTDYRSSLARMVYDDPQRDPRVAEKFEAWKRGRTGFPFVDAGMRQLRETGWMHNRVRMVTASFLTKDLHIWWPHGAAHFMAELTDGDVASNSHGWQWVAGTGTDASPYFRIFNPIQQGKRFDPNGDYVRRWVPELAGVKGAAVHQPWGRLDAADYPDPIVDHASERQVSLDRYAAARAG